MGGNYAAPVDWREPQSGAERQARYRAARLSRVPVVRMHRPTDCRGRIQRWNDTISEPVKLQTRYPAWLDALPDNQQDSTMAEALRAIAELDLVALLAIEPPRRFGRN